MMLGWFYIHFWPHSQLLSGNTGEFTETADVSIRDLDFLNYIHTSFKDVCSTLTTAVLSYTTQYAPTYHQI